MRLPPEGPAKSTAGRRRDATAFPGGPARPPRSAPGPPRSARKSGRGGGLLQGSSHLLRAPLDARPDLRGERVRQQVGRPDKPAAVLALGKDLERGVVVGEGRSRALD